MLLSYCTTSPVRDSSRHPEQSRAEQTKEEMISLGSNPQPCVFGGEGMEKRIPNKRGALLPLLFCGGIWAALMLLLLWIQIERARSCRHLSCRTGNDPPLAMSEKSNRRTITVLASTSSQLWTRGKRRLLHPSSS